MITLDEKTYTPAALAGRCANGYERDHGSVVHYVEYERQLYNTSWIALCGKRPGGRSAGFSAREGSPVTCPRCLKKATKITPQQEFGKNEIII
jgi:hypothetical protein